LHSTEDHLVTRVKQTNTNINNTFVLKLYYNTLGTGKYERMIMDTLVEHKAPNILYPVDYCVLPLVGYFFVFPFVEERGPPCTSTDVWNYLKKVALALDGCHSCNVLHCDIKPDNILYSITGDVYLCDFDSAQNETGDIATMYGTLPFWSPEVCNEHSNANNFPRDMWAFGVTIIETVYQVYPFSTIPDPEYDGNEDHACADALKTSIRKFLIDIKAGTSNLVPSCLVPPHDNKQLLQLLKGLLTWDPKKRMTAKQVVEFIVVASSAKKTLRNNGNKHKADSPSHEPPKKKKNDNI